MSRKNCGYSRINDKGEIMPLPSTHASKNGPGQLGSGSDEGGRPLGAILPAPQS